MTPLEGQRAQHYALTQLHHATGHDPTNRDHVPSKSLLIKPYPSDLAVTEICEPCNTSFSADEEYFGAFLSAVLSGSVEPAEQKLDIGRRIFERNSALKCAVLASRQVEILDGNEKIFWRPDFKRIENVLVKNARGHVYFENGEPPIDAPSLVKFQPLEQFSDADKLEFFGVPGGLARWPEVGSRWMQRLVEDGDFDQDGFLVVQPGIYRFRLELRGGIAIHSIIHEYLAAIVSWE